MTYDELCAQANALAEKALKEVSSHPSEALGLDARCGTLWVTGDWIACPHAQRQRLDYYGGFEYVDPEHVTTLGNWVFYSVNDSRVQIALDHLE